MTDDANDLRRRSWRRWRGSWHADCRDALNEAADLLPYTELGELAMQMFDTDPLWWKQHFPLTMTHKIEAIKRREDLEQTLSRGEEPMMTTWRCPDDDRGPQPDGGGRPDIVGCGRTFEAEPDFEGLIDCPHCGMWFSVLDERYRSEETG